MTLKDLFEIPYKMEPVEIKRKNIVVALPPCIADLSIDFSDRVFNFDRVHDFYVYQREFNAAGRPEVQNLGNYTGCFSIDYGNDVLVFAFTLQGKHIQAMFEPKEDEETGFKPKNKCARANPELIAFVNIY